MDSAAALEGARRYLSGLQPEDHHGDGVAQPPYRVANPWGQGYDREPRAGASELPSTDPQPRDRCGKAASCKGRSRGLSCMKGNFHVQFLGEGVAATSPPYPTLGGRPPRSTRPDNPPRQVNKALCPPLLCYRLDERGIISNLVAHRLPAIAPIHSVIPQPPDRRSCCSRHETSVNRERHESTKRNAPHPTANVFIRPPQVKANRTKGKPSLEISAALIVRLRSDLLRKERQCPENRTSHWQTSRGLPLGSGSTPQAMPLRCPAVFPLNRGSLPNKSARALYEQNPVVV